MSTKLFNLRLYLEGLKRLKVIGFAVAILSVTVSGLIPIVQWMNVERYYEPEIQSIEHHTLCLPLFATIFIAPFFFLGLFSFLNKRKESDFYHAIPYTRTCVYLSFVAAAMSFIFVIQLASAVTAGILWALNPYAVFRLSELISLTLMCMLAAAMISGIMMLAITLTGTDMTTALMFLLFMFLTRLVMFYASEYIYTDIRIMARGTVPFLEFTWFLPFGMLEFWFIGHDMTNDPFHSSGIVIYSLIVTLILFSVALLFYVIRKSEMAGNTAPNRITQHIFRCLFTLPLALLIPMFIMLDEDDPSLLLVLLVITLLVYYLYELITTKRFKNLVKATPWLPVLIIACLLYCGIMNFSAQAIYRNTPDAPEDVVAVQVNTASMQMWDNYQASLIQNTESSDPELIALVVQNLKQTVECDKTGNFEKYYADYKNEDGYYYGGYYMDQNWLTVNLRLESGKTITRKIAFRHTDYETVKQRYIRTIEVDETLFWSIPEQKLIDSIEIGQYQDDGMDYHFHFSLHFSEADEVIEIYRALAKDYNALSLDDKIWSRSTSPYELFEKQYKEEYMPPQTEIADDSISEKTEPSDDPSSSKEEESAPVYSLTLSGHLTNSSHYFYIEFCITEDLFPTTCQILQDLDFEK